MTSTSSRFHSALLASLALAAFCFNGSAVRASAVEVLPLPQEAVHPAEVIGQALAARADQQLKEEVKTYARENVFGITGDLIPAGEVTYRRAGLCTVDGQTGAALEFTVHARAKIDVGTRRWGVSVVRKVWGVDTVQVIQIVIVPKQKDAGSPVLEVRGEVVNATASKERQARQRDADGFRDRISNALRENLSKFSGDYDLKQFVNSAR